MRARITKITSQQAEPMRRREILAQYQSIFDVLNRKYFNDELPKIVIDYRDNLISTSIAAFIFDTEKKTPPKILLQLQDAPEYGINTDTINDLYHELIHYFCYLRGIKDTTGHYTYHNYNFKTAVEEHGGRCKWNNLIDGFNIADLPANELHNIFIEV